jgi:hypothetical protein
MGKTSVYNRLFFILEEKSITVIASETGIPYTTLYYYSKGTRSLPKQYENNIFNMYSREAYARTRLLGYDVKTASQRRNWNPEKLILFTGSDAEEVERYTFFNVMKIDPAHPKTLKEAMQSDYWRYFRERIEKSIKQRQYYLDELGNETWNSG